MFEGEGYKTVVEDKLSKEIIYSIGVYIQLCARIEKLIVSCICLTEDLDNDEAKNRYEELSNLTTGQLISSLKSMTENLPNDHSWYEYFKELRGYLHRFVDHRHKVVHGIVSCLLYTSPSPRDS